MENLTDLFSWSYFSPGQVLAACFFPGQMPFLLLIQPTSLKYLFFNIHMHMLPG